MVTGQNISIKISLRKNNSGQNISRKNLFICTGLYIYNSLVWNKFVINYRFTLKNTLFTNKAGNYVVLIKN
jgi:hypothetical protein